MRVLLIEDDVPTAQAIELMLRSEGFTVDSIDRGDEALDFIAAYNFDAVLLDLNLPDISGYAVLKQIRDNGKTVPVIVVSGLAGIDDKVKAFRLGADDYVTKPFHRDELVARIHAVARRASGMAKLEVIVGALTVDLLARRVAVAGVHIHLTWREFQTLELLAIRVGKVVPPEKFLDHIYGGMDEPEAKIVDVFICKLRKKLFDASGGSYFIENVYKQGFLLRENAKPPKPYGKRAA